MVEVGTSGPNSSLSFTNLTGEMDSPSLHALRRWLICVTPVRPQHFIVNTPHLPLRSRTYWITEYGGCWEATSLQLPRASEYSQRGDHTLSSGSPRNWQRWSLEDRPRWSKITDVLKLALRCWEQLQSPLFHWHTWLQLRRYPQRIMPQVWQITSGIWSTLWQDLCCWETRHNLRGSWFIANNLYLTRKVEGYENNARDYTK